MSQILIVDDHRLLLNGTISLVSDRFGNAQIRWAQTVQDALTQVRDRLPDLAIVDLSIPETSGTSAHVEHGLSLLKCLMQDYPHLNLFQKRTRILRRNARSNLSHPKVIFSKAYK